MSVQNYNEEDDMAAATMSQRAHEEVARLQEELTIVKAQRDRWEQSYHNACSEILEMRQAVFKAMEILSE